MFVLNEHRRMVPSPEPNTRPPARFALVRGQSSCAWAVRADIAPDVAAELGRLAATEPPIENLQDDPLHADEYVSLAGGPVFSGPAFRFPNQIAHPGGVSLVDRLELLEKHFRGWTADEIPWRSPIVAVMEGGYPVSVCFCATRRSEATVEAGVETVATFRGRGLAVRVTAAWAAMVRASGRIPLYSTAWSNTASRAVARKLGLIQYACDWGLGEDSETNAP